MATTTFPGTNPVIASGTYTPTLSNTTNIAASTAHIVGWYRVSNRVTVFGKVDIDPTAAGVAVLGMSLPVASNFADERELGGTGVTAGNETWRILGDAVSDRASFVATATDTANHTISFHFSYQVI